MKISKFQIIFLSAFVIFIVAGVIGFATYKGSGSTQALPQITIWGTFPKDQFDQFMAKVNSGRAQQFYIKYVQEPQASFLGDFIAALARQQGPDAILVPADMLLSLQDKLVKVPYSAYPQRTYLDTFVDEGRAYLASDGILGVPFAIDPMVMYWNRDTFNAAGIAAPPRYWDDFKGLDAKLTEKSDSGIVTKSALAMGDFTNVTNAREILGTLMLQSGNPITVANSAGIIVSAIKPSYAPSPVQAVTFFSQAVDPASDSYSWNRSWPDSRTAFLSGKLATYLAPASEIYQLRAKNPNLAFDVAAMPQWQSGGVAATYARLYGFSITKQSQNANAAFQMIYAMTQPQYLAALSSMTYLPPVSRASIASGTTDPYMDIFEKEALISRTWLDADPTQSATLFGGMIQAVTSGQKSVSQALSDASGQYDALLQQAVGQ